MTDRNKQTDALFDDATVAPDHVRYPAVPLAYQTSPFVPARELEPPPEPEPRAEAPAAEAAPPSAEPWGLLDYEEPAAVYGVDEVMVLARDPWTLFAWWEATAAGITAARSSIGADGKLTLRMHVAAVGVPPQVFDVLLDGDHGRRYLGAPRAGAYVLSALGLRSDSGRFAVIARAPRILVPYNQPLDGVVEWMEVAPARTGGARLEAPAILQRGGAEEIPGATRGTGLAARPGWPAPRITAPTSSPTSPTRSGQP
jgi:hypothetical protein